MLSFSLNKNYTQFHTKMVKNYTHFSDENGSKTFPLGAAHTCFAYIWEQRFIQGTTEA